MTTIERIAFLTRIKRELNEYIQVERIEDLKDKGKESREHGSDEASVIKTIEGCILTLQRKLTE